MSKLIQLHERVGRVDKKVINKFVEVDDDDYDDLIQFVWYYKVDNANQPGKEHVSVGRGLPDSEKKEYELLQELMNRRILRLTKATFYSGFNNSHWWEEDPINMQRHRLHVLMRIEGQIQRIGGNQWRLIQEIYERWKAYQIDTSLFDDSEPFLDYTLE
jgi:hypothetical protein